MLQIPQSKIMFILYKKLYHIFHVDIILTANKLHNNKENNKSENHIKEPRETNLPQFRHTSFSKDHGILYMLTSVPYSMLAEYLV